MYSKQAGPSTRPRFHESMLKKHVLTKSEHEEVDEEEEGEGGEVEDEQNEEKEEREEEMCKSKMIA